MNYVSAPYVTDFNESDDELVDRTPTPCDEYQIYTQEQAVKALHFETSPTVLSILENRNTDLTPSKNDSIAERKPQSNISNALSCESHAIEASDDLRAVMGVNIRDDTLKNNDIDMRMVEKFMVKERVLNHDPTTPDAFYVFSGETAIIIRKVNW